MNGDLTLTKNNYLDVVYDKKSHPKTQYPRQLIDYLRERFDIRSGSKLLDAGCGDCSFTKAFRDSGMVNVVGVDLFNNGDMSVYECNFETDKLPFEDNSFDVAFSKSILEHLKDPTNYLKEIYRILKPNGKLILMVPDGISCLFTYMMDHTHQKYYVKESVTDLLKIMGYRDVETQLFYQLPCVWKYPVLKIVCRFLQVFCGAPKKIVKNKFLRFSRELMILSSCIK